MIRYKKKELLNIIEFLKKANTLITRNLDSIKEIPIDVLMELQEAAIEIGTYLKNYGEISENIIWILEEYCENIYQLSLETNNVNQYRNITKKIKKQLTQVSYKIKNDLPDEKKEIVFLPYKVSMWDSLESVWKAASEDNNCETYVVPIPYFDKNRDGTFGEMHYEGNQYPKYVPITSWEEYKISERRPDVIYIHNPFDGANYITSVHPDFYAKELKKHTDMLVYIPYYFTNGKLPEAHLVLPVNIYSDVIVAQNKIVKEQLNQTLNMDKSVSLGTPKIDRILNCYANNIYPDELQEYVGKKKIFFLNTSISAILEHNEFFLHKIDEILNIFKNTTEALLVWRPHPLLESTLKSMRPTVYIKYKEIKKKFIDDNYGILDTGMDIDKIVAASDAYIGEQSSSVVVLFMSLGKPVYLIQPLYEECILNNNEAFFDFYLKGDNIYFTHKYFNVACKASYSSGVVDCITYFPKEPLNMLRGYTEIHEIKEKLYLTPMNARHLISFNLEKSTVAEEAVIESPTYSNFNQILRYKDYLYFIPTEYEAIIRYNYQNHEIISYTEPVAKLKKHSKEEGYFSMFGSCIVDSCIYIATPTSNYILEFDLETEETRLFQIGKKVDGYWDMLFDGKDFWLNPYKGSAIVRWNKENNLVDEFDDYPINFKIPEENKDCFIRIVDCGETILAFPKLSNMIVELEKKTGRIAEYNLELPYDEGKRKNKGYDWGSNYYFAKRIGDKIYTLSAYDNSFLEIDFKNRTYIRKTFQFSDKMTDKLKALHWTEKIGTNAEDFMYYESKYFDLRTFLMGIISEKIRINTLGQKIFLQSMENSDGSAGKCIHEYVIMEQ